MTTNNIGLYIHIPFCKVKCNYCIYTVTTDFTIINKYIDKLKKEIIYRSHISNGYTLSSIHIGGGSPSILDDKYIKDILDTSIDIFGDKDLKEVAIEINPIDVTKEKINNYTNYGVNRLVLGVQSIDQQVLEKLGRLEKREDVLNGIDIIKDYKNVRLAADILRDIGSEQSFFETVDTLSPYFNHLSVYDVDMVSKDYYNRSIDYIEGKGYIQYHITSFYKNEEYSLHNLGNWIGTDYIGIGLGAGSRFKDKRWNNTVNICDYINKDFQSTTKVINYKTRDSINEYFYMGFGLTDGIDINKISLDHNIDVEDLYEDEIKYFEKLGYITYKNSTIKITRHGQTKLNELEIGFYK